MKRLYFLLTIGMLLGTIMVARADNSCIKDSTLITDIETGVINRYIYHYDGDILVRMTRDYYTPSTTVWTNHTSETYQYDEHKNMIRMDCFEWNSQNLNWDSIYVFINEYDNHNLQTSHTWLSRRGGGLFNLHKDIWKYDEYYRVAVHIIYANADAGKKWRPYQREEYKYDLDKTIHLLYMAQADSSWALTSKTEITIDANGHEILAEGYRMTKNGWDLSNKTEVEYNSAGQITSMIEYVNQIVPPDSVEQLLPTYKTEYNYNNQGLLSSKETFNFYLDTVEKTWDSESYETYVWDSVGNNTSITLWSRQGYVSTGLLVQQTDMYYQCLSPTVEYFTLTARANNAILGNVIGSGEYQAGEDILLVAAPYPGSIFTGWDFTDLEDMSVNFIMPDADTTVVAYFEKLDNVLPPTIQSSPSNATPYNLLGQPVDENYHGIVIQNGQKRVQ